MYAPVSAPACQAMSDGPAAPANRSTSSGTIGRIKAFCPLREVFGRGFEAAAILFVLEEVHPAPVVSRDGVLRVERSAADRIGRGAADLRRPGFAIGASAGSAEAVVPPAEEQKAGADQHDDPDPVLRQPIHVLAPSPATRAAAAHMRIFLSRRVDSRPWRPPSI
jgi:hypothetical protein